MGHRVSQGDPKLRIAFCHHLSLRYGGGGEKWVIELARELSSRGHDVEVYCLPFLLSDGAKNIDPVKMLGDVPYHEGYFHRVNADVTYVTYHPLNWINFWISGPKIGGIHSHAYWLPLNWDYGLLPNLAIIANAFTSRWELQRFNKIHILTDEYPVNHRDIVRIPNFVDSKNYRPRGEKETPFTVTYSSRKVWAKGYDIWGKIKELLADKDISFKESGGLTEDELGNLLSTSHIVVVPARVDTFGLSIVETAMSKTVPIVSSLLAHRALGLPLFYADTPEEYVRRISEVREMWLSGFYNTYVSLLYHQAQQFDKVRVIDRLERMFMEAKQ